MGLKWQRKGQASSILERNESLDEPVVIMVLAELEGLRETLHLLSSPANADHLRQSIAELNAGKGFERELIEE